MKRPNLKELLARKYSIEIRPIPEEEGGGYAASIPELGELAFVADGNTQQEAIENLEEVKRSLFEDCLEKGIPIPEPKNVEDFSGRFVQRVPKELHWLLASEARLNYVSLNQYVTHILSSRHTIPGVERKLDMILERCDAITSEMGDVGFAVERSMVAYNKVIHFLVKGYERAEQPVNVAIKKKGEKSSGTVKLVALSA